MNTRSAMSNGPNWAGSSVQNAVAGLAASRARLAGPDVVRAVALIGVVVMNYHGYLIYRGGDPPETDGLGGVFHPWTGPLATRFAATFVLVAGVGVTLLTRSAVAAGRSAMRDRRVTLVRRGATLFVAGWVIDPHWPGTILPYYGALFVLGAALFTLRSRAVLLVGAAAALAGAALAWWRAERQLDDADVGWLFAPDHWTPHGLVLDTVVNGTHPLLPWLMFFCAGIVLGRLLTRDWWRPVALGGGLMLFGLATIISGAVPAGPVAARLSSTDPFDRGLLYTASALGTALAAFAAISWIAERSPTTPPISWLRHAGAMTLTLYLAHIVVFRLLVDWLDVVQPGGLGTALSFAAGFWVVAIAGAAWYHRRVGIGPAEWLYRKLGG